MSRIQTLQELMGIASRDEASAIAERVSLAIRDLEAKAARLEAVPAVSPLVRALDSLAELQDAAERLASTPIDETITREFLDLSNRRVAELRRILAAAVDERS